MKTVITFLALIIIISCHPRQEKTSPDDDPTRKHLKALFAEWQLNELKNKRLWAGDSCFMGWFDSMEFDGTINEMWGFPDSSEIHYSYADVNDDGKTDQLVTFIPAQCDGGNASMWAQIEVLMVSENDTYTTTVTESDGVYSYMGSDTSGFICYDSIGVNKIYATYYKFSENDGHCCPGITKPVILDYY